MNHRRNIKVYSATLAAFTIDHGESKSTGPDILVSFHDNDHYNSVRNKLYPPKASPMLVSVTAGVSSQMNDSTDVQVKKYQNTNDKSEMDNITLSFSNMPLGEHVGKELKTKKTIKRSAPCPCGSGLRYKKCCLARQKHAIRMERLKSNKQCEEDGLSGSEEGETISPRGQFQIVSI